MSQSLKDKINNNRIYNSFTEYIIIIVIAIISGLLVFLKTKYGILPLIDFSYIIENAHRIFLGQVPYKDFYLVLTPGTFYLIAFLFSIFGNSFFYQTVFISLLQSIGILLTFGIIKNINDNQILNLVICIMLIPTGFVIVPIPNYDIEAVFFMLLSIFIFMRIILKKDQSYGLFIISGALSGIPILFKQNIGIPFTVASAIGIIILFFIKSVNLSLRKVTSYLFGTIIIMILFYLYLSRHEMMKDFIHQVFIFPGTTRSLYWNIKQVFGTFIFGKILWLFYLPLISLFSKKNQSILFSSFIGIVYVIVPLFLLFSGDIKLNRLYLYYQYAYPSMMVLASITLVMNLLNRKIDNVRLLHYFLLITSLIVLLMSFISQRFYGSTYGTWPLFVIIISFISKYKPQMQQGLKIIILVLTIVLSISTLKNERLLFVENSGIQKFSSSNKIYGLGTQGDWLENLDELILYISKHIPLNEKIFSIPGEDPIYYLSGHIPQLKYFQLNINTFPKKIESIYKELIDRNINWVIVKNELQCPKGFIDTSDLIREIERSYLFYNSIKNYSVYKKK